jgi:hypothetical protein
MPFCYSKIDLKLLPFEKLGKELKNKKEKFFLRLSGPVKRPLFPYEGKTTESKCYKTVIDLITQIPVEYHIHTTIISEYKKCGIT